jgi:hypothetical protein
MRPARGDGLRGVIGGAYSRLQKYRRARRSPPARIGAHRRVEGEACMKQRHWEYLTLTINRQAEGLWMVSERDGERLPINQPDLARVLNELGDEGWELTLALTQSGTARTLLLKRKRAK